jgi:hypothetical protein
MRNEIRLVRLMRVVEVVTSRDDLPVGFKLGSERKTSPAFALTNAGQLIAKTS